MRRWRSTRQYDCDSIDFQSHWQHAARVRELEQQNDDFERQLRLTSAAVESLEKMVGVAVLLAIALTGAGGWQPGEQRDAAGRAGGEPRPRAGAAGPAQRHLSGLHRTFYSV